jgi:hypothetical protein
MCNQLKSELFFRLSVFQVKCSLNKKSKPEIVLGHSQNFISEVIMLLFVIRAIFFLTKIFRFMLLKVEKTKKNLKIQKKNLMIKFML